MQRTWTLEQLAILKANWPTKTADEIRLLFPDKEWGAIRSKARFLKLRKEKAYFKFSPEQVKTLITTYANADNEKLAAEFGCSVETIYHKVFRLGLKKSSEFIKTQHRDMIMNNPNHKARQSWYQKGQTPMNAGKKQREYMSAEAIERTKATRFAKGQKPWNTLPVGSEMQDTNGYIKVKVAEPRSWKFKHRMVWEQKYGPIPRGYNVQFRDGVPTNIEPENLYLISRADQLKNENSLVAKYPKEIQELIHTRGALTRQINKTLKTQQQCQAQE